MALKTKAKKGDLAPTVMPKVPPYLNVSNIFASKGETNIIRKKPEWDIPRGTPATELVRARRDLYKAEVDLAKRRETQIEDRKKLDNEWSDLEQKEEMLRASFIKFNKFVRENQEKRERAERKIIEDDLLQQKRDADIEDMQEKLNELTNIKEQMENYCKEFRMYADYLSRVVDSTNEFKSIPEILNRYEALAAARSELAERQEADLAALSSAQAEMVRLTEEKIYAVINFNTKLAVLQNRYEKARIQSIRWERALARIKSISGTKELQIKMVKSGAWNLYNSICMRKNKEPEFDMDNTEEQLMYIKSTMVDMKKIIRIAKRRAARTAVSVKPLSNNPLIEVIKIVEPTPSSNPA